MRKVKVGDYILDMKTKQGKGKDIGIVFKIDRYDVYADWIYGVDKGSKQYLPDKEIPPSFRVITQDEAFVRMI